MGLREALLGLLSAAAVLLLRGGCTGSPSHSLRYYYYLEVSKPSLEQFFVRGYLDDQPITHCSSLTGRVESLVPWMEKEEKEMYLGHGWLFNADLKNSPKLNHPTEGLHTWQAILGCELRENVSKGGFLHYGYDGMDFISFKNETLKWVAAQPQAEKLKATWEDYPKKRSKEIKDYLEETCIKCLKRYLACQTLNYTEPPVGKVTHKVVNDSLEVLICQGFGFYSKEIQATWTRDSEVCQYESLHRNVTRNSDGTYYVRLSIEIDPKERERFQCHLQHEDLQEPLVLSFKEKPATGWQNPVAIAVGVFLAVVISLVISFLIWRCRRCRTSPLQTSHDDFPLEVISSSPTSGREEDGRLLESLPQSEITLDDMASDGGWSSQRVLKDSGSTLRRINGSSSASEDLSPGLGSWRP